METVVRRNGSVLVAPLAPLRFGVKYCCSFRPESTAFQTFRYSWLSPALFAFVVTISTLTPRAARAQNWNSSLEGLITDPSGAVIPQAQVTLKNVASSQTRHTRANPRGYYTFPLIPVGIYNTYFAAGNACIGNPYPRDFWGWGPTYPLKNTGANEIGVCNNIQIGLFNYGWLIGQ